jgi:hypothetical protein
VRRVLLGEPLSIEGTRSRQKKFPEFRKKSLEAFRSRVMTVLVGWLIDFVDLHAGVYGEIGIANG